MMPYLVARLPHAAVHVDAVVRAAAAGSGERNGILPQCIRNVYPKIVLDRVHDQLVSSADKSEVLERIYRVAHRYDDRDKIVTFGRRQHYGDPVVKAHAVVIGAALPRRRPFGGNFVRSERSGAERSAAAYLKFGDSPDVGRTGMNLSISARKSRNMLFTRGRNRYNVVAAHVLESVAPDGALDEQQRTYFVKYFVRHRNPVDGYRKAVIRIESVEFVSRVQFVSQLKVLAPSDRGYRHVGVAALGCGDREGVCFYVERNVDQRLSRDRMRFRLFRARILTVYVLRRRIGLYRKRGNYAAAVFEVGSGYQPYDGAVCRRQYGRIAVVRRPDHAA